MLPKSHIILGAVFSVILFLFLGVSSINAFLVFLSSVFIDIDHYLFYIFRKKDFNLTRACRWHICMGDYHKPIMQIFHSVEFIFLVLAISLIFPAFVFIFLGLLFHSILDILEMVHKKNLKTREFFFTRYLLGDRRKYF